MPSDHVTQAGIAHISATKVPSAPVGRADIAMNFDAYARLSRPHVGAADKGYPTFGQGWMPCAGR